MLFRRCCRLWDREKESKTWSRRNKTAIQSWMIVSLLVNKCHLACNRDKWHTNPFGLTFGQIKLVELKGATYMSVGESPSLIKDENLEPVGWRKEWVFEQNGEQLLDRPMIKKMLPTMKKAFMTKMKIANNIVHVSHQHRATGLGSKQSNIKLSLVRTAWILCGLPKAVCGQGSGFIYAHTN